jgi:hypothetical protein
MRTMTRKKKTREKRKALINQIQKAARKAKTTTTVMKIFLLFSKGRFPFTSSRCQRVVRRMGAGGCQRWTTTTTSSPRL